ncbi:protein serine/threonine kinase, putative [Entamoeba invadens IP1]|uniref:Protein serine/threonine kinase, putative n=1 Tax=Entamoeba invadens IP1 TaxID=370355 RepID=A0A0A1U8G0_ENTIV|nr:protein serine/threonine kinase, putative [Entamoeba invadens IP1]ELP89346.1 protein serine/threonine kinase, putative [Entamoeba invadens IP1]|eukprot:XP_004256117.1 protein serine/threonine kinase, putative [Entamoeba invadens IP1]
MDRNKICKINDCVLPNDENGKCTTKIDNCIYLSNEKCNECKRKYYLTNNICNNNNKKPNCILQNSFGYLKLTCNQFTSYGSGCVVCKDGYYRVGLDCFECDQKCKTCNNKYSCLTCNLTNYKTNSGDCLPQNDIIGCAVNVTQSGCSRCQDGYYIINTNECQESNDNCNTCALSSNKCTSCNNSHVLITNGSCVDVSRIFKCKEITNSKCSKCVFWYITSKDGTLCELQIVWWVIFVVVMCVLIVFIVLIVSIVIITKTTINKLHTHEINKTITLFAMNKSNINFVPLQGGVCVSSNVIDLNSDIEQIEVNKDTRQVLCVGNTNKTATKIQFTISSNITKFTICIDPEVVTLKSGYACEFSVYVKPLCSCNINSTIQLVSKKLKTNEEKYNEISLIGVTQQTTRIDCDELIEDKKLGEGSFGVVYKGSYRRNVVVIKKMKSVLNDNGAMDEFEKEVALLDKFRCKYIVHFYGAVFIPNKVCMVTEFAQFGSFHDLIKHKTSDEVNMNVRVKFMLDSARGILYLHTNEILHRDIKPNNILAFTLDLNDKANAKLTDFGSSRNVNILLTNMTFTNGIGTPVYMAPEVLKLEKYKKPADIYSFAITMFEVFGWSQAYRIDTFKFA